MKAPVVHPPDALDAPGTVAWVTRRSKRPSECARRAQRIRAALRGVGGDSAIRVRAAGTSPAAQVIVAWEDGPSAAVILTTLREASIPRVRVVCERQPSIAALTTVALRSSAGRSGSGWVRLGAGDLLRSFQKTDLRATAAIERPRTVELLSAVAGATMRSGGGRRRSHEVDQNRLAAHTVAEIVTLAGAEGEAVLGLWSTLLADGGDYSAKSRFQLLAVARAVVT